MPTPPTHRLAHLLLPLLSITLNLAILGTSSRTLHIYQTSQTSNVYFLPIWNSHFDMRGLQTLVGTSVGIVVLNGIFAVVGGVCGNGGGNEGGGRGRGMVCFFFCSVRVGIRGGRKRLLTFTATHHHHPPRLKLIEYPPLHHRSSPPSHPKPPISTSRYPSDMDMHVEECARRRCTTIV